MYITLTMEIENRSFDLSIDARQKISVLFTVLSDAGLIKKGIQPHWYHSRMKGTLVSAYRTFEEEEVFGGDILTAVEVGER